MLQTNSAIYTIMESPQHALSSTAERRAVVHTRNSNNDKKINETVHVHVADQTFGVPEDPYPVLNSSSDREADDEFSTSGNERHHASTTKPTRKSKVKLRPRSHRQPSRLVARRLEQDSDTDTNDDHPICCPPSQRRRARKSKEAPAQTSSDSFVLLMPSIELDPETSMLPTDGEDWQTIDARESSTSVYSENESKERRVPLRLPLAETRRFRSLAPSPSPPPALDEGEIDEAVAMAGEFMLVGDMCDVVHASVGGGAAAVSEE
jgi:hypothetical protein